MNHAYYKAINNTVLIDGRAVVPGGLMSELLLALHRSHGGVESMKARARDAMFWPTMNANIQRV